ncbi:hypothetical protein FACS1894132_13280 [Clostridia bacterium]|nr:hypothetical protein FACS1894132_13280 [Clostridia bacterium]
MKNKYYYHTKISERKFREILRLFATDLTATDTANLTSISRNTVNKIYEKLRFRILEICEKTSPILPEKEEFEVDESYFGSSRVKGKRGREQAQKSLFLDFTNAMEKCILRLFLTVNRLH